MKSQAKGEKKRIQKHGSHKYHCMSIILNEVSFEWSIIEVWQVYDNIGVNELEMIQMSMVYNVWRQQQSQN